MTISRKTYMTFKLGLGALTGAAIFMAMPPHRLWALATLPMIVLAGLSLPQKKTRILLSCAYILFGLCGLAIGQFCWRSGELSWAGIKLMALLIFVVAIAAVRILAIAPDEA